MFNSLPEVSCAAELYFNNRFPGYRLKQYRTEESGRFCFILEPSELGVICRENDLGSLEVGKQADIITVDLQKPNLTPNFLPIHKLMLYGNASDVDTVMVQGKLRMVKRQVLDIDEAEVLKEATEESLRTIRRAGYEKLLEPSDTFWTGYRNLVFEERLA